MNKFLSILLMFTSGNIIAQNFEWAYSIAGFNSQDRGKSCTIDKSGNLYVAGFYGDSADFDPGLGVFNMGIVGGYVNVFIQKVDTNGNLLWAKSIEPNLGKEVNSITTDKDGNVLIVGWFQGTSDFDPGPGVFNLSATGGMSDWDIFIEKLDSSGNFLWAKSIGSPGGDGCNSVVTDNDGNVYFTGHFNATADMDPGPGVFNLTSNSFDAFVEKLDSNGNFIWAKGMGGYGFDMGNSITLDDSNNVITTGTFSGTNDFDPGTGVLNLPTNGGDEIFIQKLDSAGTLIWAKSVGGSNHDYGDDVTVDNSGNILVSGRFRAIADMDPGPGVANISVPNPVNAPDIFVLKLDGNGNYIWAKGIGASWSDYGNGIEVDINNNVYTTGFFGNTVDFNPGPGIDNVTTNGGNDAYILKLDSAGNYIWNVQLGGAEHDIGFSLILDNSRNIYATGMFGGSVDFDPDTGSFIMTENATLSGASDVYVVKLSQCLESSSSIFDTICYSYLSPSGNYSWNHSGIYSDVIQGGNSIGCDSIVIVNLIVQVDTSVTNTSPTLTSNTTGATYQWIDCSIMQIIPGATNQSYTATSNGSYAVIINKNGCMDTSACQFITGISLEELKWTEQVKIIPNPASSYFTIDGVNGSFDLYIYNSLGQLVLEKVNIIEPNQHIEISDIEKGMLIINLVSKDGTFFSKLVKN